MPEPPSSKGKAWEGMGWRDEAPPNASPKKWQEGLTEAQYDEWCAWRGAMERWEIDYALADLDKPRIDPPSVAIQDQTGKQLTAVVDDQPIVFTVTAPGVQGGEGTTIDIEVRCGDDVKTIELAWDHTDEHGVPHFVSEPVTIRTSADLGLLTDARTFVTGGLRGLDYQDGDVVIVSYKGASSGAQVFTSATKLQLASVAAALGEAVSYFTTLLINLREVQKQLDAAPEFEGKAELQTAVTKMTEFATERLDIAKRGVAVLGHDDWLDHERARVAEWYLGHATRDPNASVQASGEFDPRTENDQVNMIRKTAKEEVKTIVFRAFVEATIGAYRLIVGSTGMSSLRMLAGGLLSLIPGKTLGLNQQLFTGGENELGQKATPLEYFMSVFDLALMGALTGGMTKFRLDHNVGTTQPRLVRNEPRAGANDDPLKMPSGTLVKPEQMGYLPAAGRQAAFVSRQFDVVVGGRATKLDAMPWRADGAAPKSELLKTKTLEPIDELIGGPVGQRGLVPEPFQPRLPSDRSRFTDAEWKTIQERVKARQDEYDGPVGQKTRKLVEDGEFTVRDGMMRTKDGRLIAGDYDIWEITFRDGSPVPPELYVKIVAALEGGHFEAAHGAHMRWNPQKADYLKKVGEKYATEDEAIKAYDSDRKIYEDIVKRHQPGGEALIVFAPNQPPMLLYAGQAAGKKWAELTRGITSDDGPIFVHTPRGIIVIPPSHQPTDGAVSSGSPDSASMDDIDWAPILKAWEVRARALQTTPPDQCSLSVIDGKCEFECGMLPLIDPVPDCPYATVTVDGDRLCIESTPGADLESDCVRFDFRDGATCNGRLVYSCTLGTASTDVCVYGAKEVLLNETLCELSSEGGGWTFRAGCDGELVPQPSEPPTWYADGDADGFGDPYAVPPVDQMPKIRLSDGSLECETGSVRVLEHGGDCPALEMRCEGETLLIDSVPGSDTSCIEVRIDGGGLCNGERVDSCVLETGPSCAFAVEGAEHVVLDGLECDASGAFTFEARCTSGSVSLDPGVDEDAEEAEAAEAAVEDDEVVYVANEYENMYGGPNVVIRTYEETWNALSKAFLGEGLAAEAGEPTAAGAPSEARSEAKSNLGALYDAEKAFFQEKDRYSSLVTEVGFAPERGNRSAYSLGEDDGLQAGDTPAADANSIDVDDFRDSPPAQPPDSAGVVPPVGLLPDGEDDEWAISAQPTTPVLPDVDRVEEILDNVERAIAFIPDQPAADANQQRPVKISLPAVSAGSTVLAPFEIGSIGDQVALFFPEGANVPAVGPNSIRIDGGVPPDRYVPEAPLSAFGETTHGTWTLRIEDTVSSEGPLSDWKLQLDGSDRSAAEPFTGRFRPEAPVSALGETASGSWTLRIEDTVSSEGPLSDWKLQLDRSDRSESEPFTGRFRPDAQVSERTSSQWSMYFDGSDVGLDGESAAPTTREENMLTAIGIAVHRFVEIQGATEPANGIVLEFNQPPRVVTGAAPQRSGSVWFDLETGGAVFEPIQPAPPQAPAAWWVRPKSLIELFVVLGGLATLLVAAALLGGFGLFGGEQASTPPPIAAGEQGESSAQAQSGGVVPEADASTANPAQPSGDDVDLAVVNRGSGSISTFIARSSLPAAISPLRPEPNPGPGPGSGTTPAPATHTITIEFVGTGEVTAGGETCTSTCTIQAAAGTEVTVNAPGATFTGDVTGSESVRVVADGPKRIVATFSYPVTLVKTGDGTVRGLQEGTTRIAHATMLTIEAEGNPGSKRVEFGGACALAGSADRCTVVVNGPMTITVTFSRGTSPEPEPPAVAAPPSPPASGGSPPPTTGAGFALTQEFTNVIAVPGFISDMRIDIAWTGATGTVTFVGSGLPSPASVDFTDNPATSSTFAEFRTPSGTAVGSYTVTITGTDDDGDTQTITVQVHVKDLAVSASPSSRTVTAGESTSYSAALDRQNGFSFEVTVTVQSLPAGATASVSLAPDGNSASVTITTSPSTPAGTYTLTIRAEAAPIVRTTTVVLTVNAAPSGDFSISATPNVTIVQGLSGGPSLTVNRTGGLTGAVGASAGGLPPGVSSSSPTITGTSGFMSLFVSTSAPTGSFTITITATSGSLVRTTTFTLNIVGFSLSASPPSSSTAPGGSVTFGIGVVPDGSFTGFVGLSCVLPAGMTGSFSPNPTNGSSTLTVNVGGSVAPGDYTITITGTFIFLTRTTTVTVTVTPGTFLVAQSNETRPSERAWERSPSVLAALQKRSRPVRRETHVPGSASVRQPAVPAETDVASTSVALDAVTPPQHELVILPAPPEPATSEVAPHELLPEPEAVAAPPPDPAAPATLGE